MSLERGLLPFFLGERHRQCLPDLGPFASIENARQLRTQFLDLSFDRHVHILAFAVKDEVRRWVDRVGSRDRGAYALRPRSGDGGHDFPRSEEHTSELQSLMRISYAVFCLKKKNTKNTYITH